MLKYPVIAAFITNLTDARYFAARGVDYLLYDLDQISISNIAEIQEWVSGPEALLLLSEGQIGNLDEAIIKLSPAAVGMKSTSIQSIEHLSGHVAFFEWLGDSLHLEEVSFVAYDNHNASQKNGIILQGGIEELVGVKSFEELDDIFDQLEVE